MRLVFIVPNIDYYKGFFSDVNKKESVIVLGKYFSILKRFELFFFGNRSTPKLIYWLAYLALSNKVNLNAVDVVAITDLVQKNLPRGFIKWLKGNTKYKDMKFLLLFYNKVSTLYGMNGNIDLLTLPDNELTLAFDRIYSYDLDESKRFGFEYYIVLSDVSRFITKECDRSVYDLLYCGCIGAKWKIGRYYEVNRIHSYLTENGVNCHFHLVLGKGIDVPNCDYTSKKKLHYYDMIKMTKETKVILDIVSNDKNGISPRFYEALMYNKKYLTNNKMVLKHPYYNPKYMRVYDEVDDIDVEWIRSDEVVDYEYDGYYTPDEFYRKILELYDSND